MKIQSLENIVEEAGYIEEKTRNLAGAVTNVRTFEQNFIALDNQHRGAYAFVAFHPVADHCVEEYIAEGTLGGDAGPDILALFLVAPRAPRMPREYKNSDARFGISLSLKQHPAYDLARRFFPKKTIPQLPGLVFFDRLFEPKSSIYVLLNGKDKVQIRSESRTIFEGANRSIRAKTDAATGSHFDFDRFAGFLVRKNLPYYRAGSKGIKAAAFITMGWIVRNRGKIAAVVPKLVGLGAKAAKGGA